MGVRSHVSRPSTLASSITKTGAQNRLTNGSRQPSHSCHGRARIRRRRDARTATARRAISQLVSTTMVAISAKNASTLAATPAHVAIARHDRVQQRRAVVAAAARSGRCGRTTANAERDHRDQQRRPHHAAVDAFGGSTCCVGAGVLEVVLQAPARDRPRSAASGPAGDGCRRGGGAAPGRTAIQR